MPRKHTLLLCALFLGSPGCAVAGMDGELGPHEAGAKDGGPPSTLADAGLTNADAGRPDTKPAADTGTAWDSGSPVPDVGTLDTGSSDAAPLTYPLGPYGLTKGNVFPNLNLLGHRKGATAATMISLEDFYDPTGAKKIHAVYLAVHTMASGECQSQEAFFRDTYATKYEPRGARVLTAIVADSLGAAPSHSWLMSWISTYKMTHELVADPERKTLPTGTTTWPRSYAIDPRTMVIESVTDGMPASYKWGPTIVELDDVLAKNGA